MTSPIFSLSRIPFGFGSQKELYKADQVPEEFKELYIIRGYRSPRSSPKQCFYSIFIATNETFNFWTHFLPAVYFLWRMIEMWPEMDFFGVDGRFTQPLLALMINICLFLFMSAIAHTFNAMSDKARHVCFFLDYGALSLYSIGAASAYRSYSVPAELEHSTLMSLYIPVAMLNATISVIMACQTRFMQNGIKKKLVRFISFSWPYIWDQVPIIYRLYYCEAAAHQGGGMSFLVKQNLFAALSAFMYASHMPERLSPGSFDIIGHSHQLFHIFSVIGTYAQVEGVLLDLQATREAMVSPDGLTYDHIDTYAIPRAICFIITHSIIILYFSLRLYNNPSAPPCSQSCVTTTGYIHKDGVRTVSPSVSPLHGFPEGVQNTSRVTNRSSRTSKKNT